MALTDFSSSRPEKRLAESCSRLWKARKPCSMAMFVTCDNTPMLRLPRGEALQGTGQAYCLFHHHSTSGPLREELANETLPVYPGDRREPRTCGVGCQ